jgi:hypothetical protein
MNRLSRVGIAVVLLAGVLWAGGVAEAASSTTVTWKVSSLNKGEKKRLSTLVSTNSPGVKTWAKRGSCSLAPPKKPTMLTMGMSGSCTLTLKIAKSGRYAAKSSNQTITLARTVAPTTSTTVAPTTSTTVAPTTSTTVAPTTSTTVASTTSTTAAPVELTCAAGGVCALGETGLGGGPVFYYSVTAFTSIGSDCGTNCHYLEAAPSDQSTGIVWATTAAACYNSGSTTSSNDCQSNSIYLGDLTAQAASRTASTAIGKGMENTNQAYARITTVGSALTTDYAAGVAWEYENNSKTDWFLPSIDELNELCKYAKNTGQTSGGGTRCAGGSAATLRGFSTDGFWSSSELDNRFVPRQSFFNGDQTSYGKEYNSFRVRPVRAG